MTRFIHEDTNGETSNNEQIKWINSGAYNPTIAANDVADVVKNIKNINVTCDDKEGNKK